MERIAKRVLLVEDEDNIALALGLLIGRLGYEMQRARTGQEAIRALQTDTPDLVVLDVMLAQGSGYEVCQFIRENNALSDVKVLMMSAGGKMAQRKGLALGADAFFVKPFDTKLMMQAIRDLLDGRACA